MSTPFKAQMDLLKLTEIYIRSMEVGVTERNTSKPEAV